MLDTIRTLAELNALFADNGMGGINAQDIRDLMVSINVYGEIGAANKAAISLASGWQALDFDAEGLSTRGLNVDTTNKWIDQIPVNMEADLTLMVIFKGEAGRSYDFTVFKDPAGTPSIVNRMTLNNIDGNSEVRAVSWSTSISLAANDVLQAGVRPSAASSNFELINGVFRVQRKGIE